MTSDAAINALHQTGQNPTRTAFRHHTDALFPHELNRTGPAHRRDQLPVEILLDGRGVGHRPRRDVLNHRNGRVPDGDARKRPGHAISGRLHQGTV